MIERFRSSQGGFRRLRAATYFAHGGKVGKTPPGTRPMDYGSAMLRLGHRTAFPGPRYGGYPLKWAEYFRRAKSGVPECGPVRPHWGPE